MGTFETDKLNALISEIKKYKLDIVALQETKQFEMEIMEMDDIFFKSGGENRILGTGFMAQKRYKEGVMSFNPISDRLCWIW